MDSDYSSWLRIKATVFDRQIRFFKKIGHFIRPEDLFKPERLKKNRLNLLLTFDDGYSSNYFVGFPIIKKHGIPALFFVSTWNMQTGQPFWFDSIIQPIQHHRLDTLELSQLGLRDYRFSRWGSASRWDDIHALLEDVKCRDKTQNGRLVEEICAYLQRRCIGLAPGPVADYCRPISAEQIVEMHRSGLCFFGSHAHRHTILTNLPDDELAMELRVSKEILENTVGEKILNISYPNGNADERLKKACRYVGYQFGYTVKRGVVGPGTNEMLIPRLLVGGYDSTARVLRNVVKEVLR